MVRDQGCPASSTLDHLQKLLLVDNLYTELLSLLQLRPGFLAGENVIGLLAHAAADLAAERFNSCRGFLARHRGHGAGEHESFPSENSRRGGGGGLFTLRLDPQLADPGENFPAAGGSE